jgi:hypothetical protein
MKLRVESVRKSPHKRRFRMWWTIGYRFVTYDNSGFNRSFIVRRIMIDGH